jgi:glycosyltransferase involved in cell wall biosynthesis
MSTAATHCLLLSHLDPPIHGQAVMAMLLVEQARTWEDVEFHAINSVFAEDRRKLGNLSLGKVVRLLRYLCAMITTCLRRDIDTIILTQSFFRGSFLKDSIFLLLAFALRKKCVIWLHMDANRLEWDTLPNWFQKYARFILRLPTRWVLCAPSLIAKLPTAFSSLPTMAICNGIEDPNEIDSKQQHTAARVIYISTMTAEKGWRELFDAAEELCGSRSDLCFDFYGEPGPDLSQATLANEFANSTFPDRIQWHGRVEGEKKTMALMRSSLFCLPSWTEAFPLVVLEAMACGLPVIATDVGGVRDAITEEENGWLYPARDSQALVKTLQKALERPTQLTQIGVANREKFVSSFSVAAFGRQWHDLLVTLS